MRQQIKNLLAFLLENFLTVHMKIDNITVLYNAVIKRDSEKEAEKEMRNLEESATQQKILEAAKQEFLEKGFQGASLRNIVKTAGVTTGAFYGYYSNKEALFAALVEEHAAAVMGCFMQAQDNFEQLSGEEQSEHLSDVAGSCMEWCVDYMYDHYDAFKLILCCSEGTPYAHFIHNMVEVEVESTYKFMDQMCRIGKEINEIDPEMCHMLASGMFGSMFELIVHDMPREKVHEYVRQLREFYTAGWMKILGFTD